MLEVKCQSYMALAGSRRNLYRQDLATCPLSVGIRFQCWILAHLKHTNLRPHGVRSRTIREEARWSSWRDSQEH